jgi:hypothetical protein
MRDVTGAGSAAELARAIMLGLHGDTASRAFADPPGYRLGAVCSDSGDDAGCGDTLPEWTSARTIAASQVPDPAATSAALAALIAPADDAASVTIVSPRDNMRVIRNPEVPADLASLPLKAAATPAAIQVTWYVDGKPFLVSAAKDIARWPLLPGTHTFEARIPFRNIASKPVTIVVE